MRYTFMCKPGRFGRPGAHAVIMGSWQRLPGWIILQHGTMTEAEFRRISGAGILPVYKEGVNNIIRIYQDLPERHASRYRWEKVKPVGILWKKRDNIYIGKINLWMEL